MNTNIENRKSIKRSDLPAFIGKEIIILSHTPSKLEGLEVAWYKKHQKVKLLEFHDLENIIKIETDGKIYKLNLHTIDEITL